MADNTVNVRLQSAYKTSADWDTLNPVLKNGEVGYVSSPDSMYGWYKIGNGTSTWKQLPYAHRPLHFDDLEPLIHKKYESTSYYATSAGSWETASWYFMSIKPDSWYKPWRVKFKVHSYCPSHANVDSYTWATYTGRADSIIYCNWNERYDAGHYYLPYYPLKKAGFDAGYGHAIGVSILYSSSYTSSGYYRTFEIDYYECENCTVTILDTPVKWANWIGTGTTNYGSLGGPDAYNRGLRETGDDNTVTENRIGYFPGKTGAKGIWAASLFMEDANGTYQDICTASDGTVTSNNRTTATTKIANTNGFKVGGTIWYTNTTYAANTNISGSAVVYSSISLFDSRYAFNTTLTANSLTPYKEVYLVGTIHDDDNLFYLDTVWWTQTPTDTSKIYILVGACFDSTTSNCRVTLYEQNIWYYYDGTMLREYVHKAKNADAATNAEKVNNLTVQTAVPANAKFTDSAVTLEGHYTPSSSGSFTPSAGGTTTDISTTTLNIITGLQKDAKGHITGVVSGSIKSTNTPNTDEKQKMTPASATKFYPAGGTATTANTSTAYFSSAVYIQGTSVFANNFVGTATTASYAANAAKVNNLTVQTAVPQNAKFTDSAVTQTASTAKMYLVGDTGTPTITGGLNKSTSVYVEGSTVGGNYFTGSAASAITADSAGLATEAVHANSADTAGTAALSMHRVFIQGTQTTATTTGKWTGDASPYFNSADDLVDGQEITYWVPLPTTGNVTLNLKFGNGTSSGEVNCYYGNTSRLTSHYGQGQAVHLTYRKNVKIPSTGTNTYTGWWADANYDSNSNTIDVLQGSGTIPVAGATAGLKQYSLFAEDANGKYSSFTTQNGTAVTKTINRTDYFDISKIYYCSTSGNFATNANIGSSVFRWASALVDLRYTLNINGNNGLTARKPLYLKFDAASTVIGTEGRPCYKLAGTAVNDWWTQTLPTSADDIIYVKVSEAVYDWYRADLDVQQRFFKYGDNDNVQGYDALTAYRASFAKNAESAGVAGFAYGANKDSSGHVIDSYYLPTTAKYALSTASGGMAATAHQTEKSLTLQINGGSSKTFNGSAAVSFDVTTASLGLGDAALKSSGAFKSSSYEPTRNEVLAPIGDTCNYSGSYGIAIGQNSTASKSYSLAAGSHTITPRNNSAVFGTYNSSTSSMTMFDIGVGDGDSNRVSAFMTDLRGGSIVSDLIFASKVSGNKLGSNYCGIPGQPSIRHEYAVVNSWPAFLESDTSHMVTTSYDLVTTSMYALGVITPQRYSDAGSEVAPGNYMSRLRGIRDSFNTYSVPFTNTISGTGTVTGSVDITFPFTFYKQPIAIYISIGGNIQLTGESITDDFGGKSAAAIVDPQLHINGSYNVPATGATTASVAYRLRGFDSGAKTVKGNILILFD